MIQVIKPGFYTSIQDRGRFGFRHFGVPVAGVMDHRSAQLANELLENDPDAAVLEITMTGPELEFSLPGYIAITGAPMAVYLNKEEQDMNTVIQVGPGDRLYFGKLLDGFRTYMAVKGGIRSKEVLGSRSEYIPITVQSCFKKGQEIPVEASLDFQPKITALHRSEDTEVNLEVVTGPEFNWVTAEQQKILFDQNFTIAKENNRMAYQLVEPIGSHTYNMLTSATLPGTVQHTPSGKLIILMRDAQTTGGYPRILHLTQDSIARLAQKKTGDQFRFVMKED